MLIYKKILLGQNNEVIGNNEPDPRVAVLEKEIRQLTDLKYKNDKFSDNKDVVDVNGGLNDGFRNYLEDKLPREDISKMVKNLKWAISILPHYDDDKGKQKRIDRNNNYNSAKNLLDELMEIQAKKVYTDFLGNMDKDKLKDLNHLFTDDEIENFANEITKKEGSKFRNEELQDLYLQMAIAYNNPDHFKRTDRKYFNTINLALDQRLDINGDNKDDKLISFWLDKTFRFNNGEIRYKDLSEIVSRLWISDWNGGSLGEDSDIGKLSADAFKEIPVDLLGKVKAKFIEKFNDVNGERIKAVGYKWNELISGLDADKLNWLKVDGDVIKKSDDDVVLDTFGKIFPVLSIDASNFGGKILDLDELSEDHFDESRKWWAEVLKKKIEEHVNSVSLNKGSDGGEGGGSWWNKIDNLWWNMNADLKGINNVAVDDKQFLQLNNSGELTFNVENAKNFLSTINESDFNEYWGISKTGWVWVDISHWRAINSAVQILLNENGAAPKLTIDGKWIHSKNKSRNAYYNAIWEFQDKNNLTPKRRGHLDFDTLSCLIADPISVLNIWKIRGNKFVFNDKVELSDDNGDKKYIIYNGEKYVGWEKWLTNDHWYCTFVGCGDFYIWWFLNWNLHWYWERFYSDWDKYEWKWENDEREWQWTYTWKIGNEYIWDWKNGNMDWQWTFSIHSENDKVYNVGAVNGVLRITGPVGVENLGKYLDWKDGWKIVDTPPN